MPADTMAESNPEDDQLGGASSIGGSKASEPVGGLAQATMGGSPGKQMQSLLTRQISGLEQARTKKKEILDNAIKNLEGRANPSGPSAEELFRLSAAFAAPTKTGSFFETLAPVGNTAADLLKARRENASGIEDLKQKYQLQGIDVDSEHLKELIEAQKALQSTSNANSTYGKTAQDEGLTPGTPEFGARVKELAQVDVDAKLAKAKGPQPGAFDTKTGNFVADNGTVIKASEVKEDRTNRDAMIKLQDQLKLLDKKTIKNADALFDYTGAGAGGDLAKTIGSKLFPETAKAQSKITAAALNDRLKNLPPGPASDKDIAQAKSTFPGFGNAQNLQDWTDRTNQAIDNYIKRQDAKYGNENWYGASKAPGKPSDGPSEGANPAATPGQPPVAPPTKPAGAGSGPAANPVSPPFSQKVPKKGAVLNGHRFLGGDPSVESNWEKV